MQLLNDKAQNIPGYFWQIWVCAIHDVQHLIAIKIQIYLKSSNSRCHHLYDIAHRVIDYGCLDFSLSEGKKNFQRSFGD